MRTSEIVQKMQAARQSLQFPALLAKLDRYDLMILDDLSYVRKDQAETSVLSELISERYERRSLLITAKPALLRMGRYLPRSGHDRGRHRPARTSLDNLRTECRKLQASQCQRQQARPQATITFEQPRRRTNNHDLIHATTTPPTGQHNCRPSGHHS